MKHLILTITLIFGATAASAFDYKSSAIILLTGEIIYSAPMKNVNDEVMERSVFYHVRLTESIDGYEKGIYICDVFSVRGVSTYTECGPASE